MDLTRVARLVVAVRRDNHLRQVDLAKKANVGQGIVSRIERGDFGGMALQTIDRVARELQIDLRLEARWHGGAGDRLVDRDHARLVEMVVATLGRLGWDVLVEFSFNVYGERGSVDVLAFHPGTRSLLIVEVKTRLTDLQAFLASFGRKVRLVPGVVRAERGWDVDAIGRLLVAADSSTNRAIVRRHQATFDTSFSGRAQEVRRWIEAPTGELDAIWFVGRGVGAPAPRPVRVRRTRSRPQIAPQPKIAPDEPPREPAREPTAASRGEDA